MSVPLTQPIAPGGSATIEVAWTAHVPRTFARTGAIGNFFFIAQWFPKLGVLQEDGWNCHQFHAGTEFFSDYGVYDVSLTVPAGWPLGATGVERERRDNADGTTTHRYYQEDVHDFAWTTSPDYLVRTARFEHPRLPPVEMRLLLQPEHAAQADRHFDATRTTLKYYGEWYGAYPYGHITIVDPAFQSGAGGMEYPTLFTAGTRWLAPGGVTTPEGVTVHEAGHQFWYGIVGNNEFEDAWMDEGFNTFSTARAVAQVYEPNFLALRYFGGFVPWVFSDIALSRETDGNRLAGYRRDAKSDAQSTPTYRYFPSTGGSITYNKTALWLNTMERWLGWPVLQRILSAHFAPVEVQAPDAGRFLRDRERGQRPGSRLVLRPGVPQLERVRLRRAGSEERTRRRPVPHERRRPTLRRSDLSGGRARDLRERRTRHRALGRQGSLEALHLRSAGAGRVRAGRSEPRAAARRGLHEQFEDARAEGAGRGHEVVDDLDGLAAGLPAVVGGARMSPLAAWLDGARRVNRAPAILIGVWALTLLVSVPLALRAARRCWRSISAPASPPTRRPAA